MKNLGFSLIGLDILSTEEKDYVFDRFDLFDVSITQLDIIEPKKVLSVQSLFFGTDLTGKSFVGSDNSFQKLLADYYRIIDEVTACNFHSVIFGSPGLRRGDVANKTDVLAKRLQIFAQYALENNIIFYVEALPANICDYLTTHTDLLNLAISTPIHVDFATMIANGENIYFLRQNVNNIARYHVSVPGYLYNFSDYPVIKTWCEFLMANNIPGTIEVQKQVADKKLINELEWLIEKI